MRGRAAPGARGRAGADADDRRDQGRRRQGHRGGQQRRAGRSRPRGTRCSWCASATPGGSRHCAEQLLRIMMRSYEPAGAARRRLGAGARRGAPAWRATRSRRWSAARATRPWTRSTRWPTRSACRWRRCSSARRRRSWCGRGRARTSRARRSTPHLLDRFERPGVFGELYAIRFHAGEAREAPPHPFGVEERLHVLAGRVRVGPADAPVELGPGRLRVVLRLGPARLRSARGGLGHPADPDREVVAMKRAARMDGVAGFGIDRSRRR